MRSIRNAACILAAIVALGTGLLLAREPIEAPKVVSQDLYVRDFAGDPTKEVRAQLYTFPPHSSVPWHIHPDAHEMAYIIEGTSSGQASRPRTSRPVKRNISSRTSSIAA